MRAGSITPVNFSTSEFWRMPMRFSPAMNRLPLASTWITVTVIVPLKRLLEVVAPLPSKVLDALALASSGLIRLPSRPLTPGSAASNSPLRSVLEFALWLALSFSLICTVRMSPT
jgi:hypothetical protein